MAIAATSNPGSSGTRYILVVLLGLAMGMQNAVARKLAVPDLTTTVLTLKAVIPQQLEITPTFVFWGQGEAPKPKTIVVRAAKDFPVKHLRVTSSSPDFQAKVEETGNGQFKIDVQPQDTKRPIASTLTIQTEDSPKIFYATARITNAPAIQ